MYMYLQPIRKRLGKMIIGRSDSVAKEDQYGSIVSKNTKTAYALSF